MNLYDSNLVADLSCNLLPTPPEMWTVESHPKHVTYFSHLLFQCPLGRSQSPLNQVHTSPLFHMAKFYQHPASANAFGVAACLDVSGYEHEKVFTDIMKGEQMTPEFIAMNPYHQIPTLQTASGFSMWEGNSIMRYVAGQSKPELLGAGAEQQAMVNVCLDSSMGGFYKDGAVALAYPVFGFAKASEEPVEERQEKFKKHMDVFFESGKFVKDGSFMCGDSLTIADFRMWALITFMKRICHG